MSNTGGAGGAKGAVTRLLAKAAPPQRIGRFATVAVSNAVVDLGTFNVLVFLLPTRNAGQIAAYNTLAVMAAMTNGYLWHSRWTFGDRAAQDAPARWRQRLTFTLQVGVNLAVNDGVVAILAFLFNLGHVIPAALASNAAKLLAMGAASASSYLMMQHVVFRRQTAPQGQGSTR